MKIVFDFPPNFEVIKTALPDVVGNERVIFTYGDTVYFPYGKHSIPEHLKVHERTHTKQQGSDPDLWWIKYLSMPSFRLEQELEAYRRQYKFFVSKNHNIREQRNFLVRLAADLSSNVYGGIVNLGTAITKISEPL